MVQATSDSTSNFRARYMIQPQLRGSSSFGRTPEKKWGEEPASAKRDIDDRINFRMTNLERRADNLETAMKVGVFVVVVAGTGVAAYQNWDTIQNAAASAWEKLPTYTNISNAFYEKWDKFKGYFSQMT